MSKFINVTAFHDHCADGLMSAAVVDYCLNRQEEAVRNTIGVTYENHHIAMNYDNESYESLLKLVSSFKDEYYDRINIYIVDYSLKWARLVALAKAVPNVTVILLDHHLTAWDNLELEKSDTFSMILRVGETGKIATYLDTNKSGALLTWDHFSGSLDEETPNAVKYTSDRDLWQFNYPESRAFHAWFAESILNNESLDFYSKLQKAVDCLTMDQGMLAEVLTIGHSILAAFNAECRYYASNYDHYTIAGKVFYTVCCPYKYMSEVGNRLAVRNPGGNAMLYNYIEGNKIKLSFRSDKDNPESINCAEFAKEHFGGGGHKNAAGADIPRIGGSYPSTGDLTRSINAMLNKDIEEDHY